MIRRKIIFALTAIVCHTSLLVAQNTLINGSFEGSYSTGSTSGCVYFFGMTGAYITHGTAQIGGAGAADLVQFAHMWYQNSGNWGEGVALSMNTTTKDRQEYTLCFWYRTDNDPGTVNFLLTTNPAQSSFSNCGDPIPSFSPSQVLTPATPLPAAANWTYYSMTFTANSNAYNTLVFYPSNTSASVFQLDIDGVVLSTCDPALQMDMSNYPIPSGYFQRSNYIQAGSHVMGSTTTAVVTADANVNTTFRAGNFVLLNDNFMADPNTGHFFLAELGPCTDFCTGGAARMADTRSLSTIQSDFPEPLQAEVYPNPFTGMLGFNNLNTGDVIEIYNAEGRLVWKTVATGEQFTVDPAIKTRGIFLVKITNASGKYIVKQVIRE